MITSLYGALETGLIYAIMALGVYISFRILDFPDLTVDGSFVTGGGVAAISIIGGVDPNCCDLTRICCRFPRRLYNRAFAYEGKYQSPFSRDHHDDWTLFRQLKDYGSGQSFLVK